MRRKLHKARCAVAYWIVMHTPILAFPLRDRILPYAGEYANWDDIQALEVKGKDS
jgi:hypothetical protein